MSYSYYARPPLTIFDRVARLLHAGLFTLEIALFIGGPLAALNYFLPQIQQITADVRDGTPATTPGWFANLPVMNVSPNGP